MGAKFSFAKEGGWKHRSAPFRRGNANVAQLVEQLIRNWKRGVFTGLHRFPGLHEKLMNTGVPGIFHFHGFTPISIKIHGDRRKRP
jgi:hypothetical protein